MKKELKRISSSTYYYKDSKRVEGVPPYITGYLTGIRGDLTDITGDLTDITGDLTDIRGDLTNIRGALTDITGSLTGIRGDLDDCEITTEERAKGIRVEDLIKD